MKKITIAILFSVMSATAFSQAQLAIGLKGGLNFANLDASSTTAAYNSRTGYHFGAFALIKFGKLGIQPEIIYSKQGSTVKINAQDFDSNFDYFNVPIILKLYTIAGINIQVGPQFGFVSGAKLPLTSGGSGYTLQDVSDKLSGADISAALGLGWDAPFGLSVDARYNLGLNKSSISSYGDVKNQVIQVSLGYKLFKIGK